MIHKLTSISQNKSQSSTQFVVKKFNVYLRTTVVGYFVTKYVLKAGYPTSGSKFDIFSG